MAVGQTLDGKPVQAGDQVTLMGSIASVSLPNITVTLKVSGGSITSAYSDFNGPTASGTAKVSTPSAGDQVNANGVCQSVSGSGSTASVVVKLTSGTNVTIDAEDCYASQSL